tara:strand:+ start:1997 stop:2785 length:789 start_codon:yes stop_codon:yes gene_type:complete
MALKIKNLKISERRIGRTLSVYERQQIEFAGKVTLTNYAKDYRKNVWLKPERVFTNLSRWTRNSPFAIQDGLSVQFGIKDISSVQSGKKTNPAANYLFPTIGGGETTIYETLFMQHLRRSNFMLENQYPFANLDSRWIRTSKNGRVTPTTLQNTMIGLGKTRDGEIQARSKRKGKIQDARVINFRTDQVYSKKTYRAGIYREVAPNPLGQKKNKSYLTPLFFYGDIPSVQRKKKDFSEIVFHDALKRVPKMWLKKIEELTKR